MKKLLSSVLCVVIIISLISSATGCSLGDKKFVAMTEACLEIFINQNDQKLKKVMNEKDVTQTLKNLQKSEKDEAKSFIEGLGAALTPNNISKMQEIIRKTYAKTKYKIGNISKENKTAIVEVDIYGIDFQNVIKETTDEIQKKMDTINNMQAFFDEFITIINQKLDSVNNLENSIKVKAKYNFDKGQYQLSQEYNFLDKVASASLGYAE